MKVTNRFTGKELTPQEILDEVNRGLEDEWEEYTLYDFDNFGDQIVKNWINPFYFVVTF